MRRVEALTGEGALAHGRRESQIVQEAAGLLRAQPAELTDRVARLLERQKEGKRRMKMVGSVEVPQEAFIEALQVDAAN